MAKVGGKVLQIEADVGRCLISKGAILVQRSLDDLLQFARHGRIHSRWRGRRAIQNAVKDYRRGISAKRQHSRSHLIQNHAK